MKDLILIGTRGSALALAQAGEICDRLRAAHPRLSFDLKIIKTTGDKMKSASLPKGGGKGLFTKELEQALLQRKIALAVHSLKDLPTDIPAGLRLAAVPEREDPRDVLVFKDAGWSPEQGGTVATSSPRRAFQLKHRWHSLRMVEIRGNVETRLKKLLHDKDWDAVVLAAAGLKRLGMLSSREPEHVLFEAPPSDRELEVRKILDIEGSPPKPAGGWPLRFRWLELDEMLPAPGQAALGIEIRADDERTQSLTDKINRFASMAETAAERAFLAGMGGGCLQPIAAAGRAMADLLSLRGVVFSADGAKRWEDSVEGPLGKHEELGRALAERLLSKGAPPSK